MNYSNFIDPLFLDRFTYLDSNGKRRVKNPYRNRKSYAIIIQEVDEYGDFIWTVPEDIVGKSVFVEFPSGKDYKFTVSAATKEVTILNIPISTYIEIHVVNPKPLPPSEHDLYWDDLPYDAQKSMVAAWGDIDLICNVLYPSSVEVELNFDDQNTLKYGLVGWRNNCGNLRNASHGYVDIPSNSYYIPPAPDRLPPSPPEPKPKDPEIGHDYDLKFVMRWEDNAGTDLDLMAYIDHDRYKRVFYTNKIYSTDEGTMWLDYDYMQHGENAREEKPEIVTVLGFKNSIISIQILNYGGGSLREDVTLDVMDIHQNVLKSFTIRPYLLAPERKSFWVCDVDLSTWEVIEKMKEIPSVGYFN